jgi:hypothetical protein
VSATERFEQWHKLDRRRQTAISEGLCTCCAFISRTGDPGPRPVRAVCEWICPSGNRELLCTSCLRYWQANAVDDVSLQPAVLVML